MTRSARAPLPPGSDGHPRAGQRFRDLPQWRQVVIADAGGGDGCDHQRRRKVVKKILHPGDQRDGLSPCLRRREGAWPPSRLGALRSTQGPTRWTGLARPCGRPRTEERQRRPAASDIPAAEHCRGCGRGLVRGWPLPVRAQELLRPEESRQGIEIAHGAKLTAMSDVYISVRVAVAGWSSSRAMQSRSTRSNWGPIWGGKSDASRDWGARLASVCACRAALGAALGLRPLGRDPHPPVQVARPQQRFGSEQRAGLLARGAHRQLVLRPQRGRVLGEAFVDALDR